eukprot:6205167-Pleurochrysis_carterae.AAC.3
MMTCSDLTRGESHGMYDIADMHETSSRRLEKERDHGLRMLVVAPRTPQQRKHQGGAAALDATAKVTLTSAI